LLDVYRLLIAILLLRVLRFCCQ